MLFCDALSLRRSNSKLFSTFSFLCSGSCLSVFTFTSSCVDISVFCCALKRGVSLISCFCAIFLRVGVFSSFGDSFTSLNAVDLFKGFDFITVLSSFTTLNAALFFTLFCLGSGVTFSTANAVNVFKGFSFGASLLSSEYFCTFSSVIFEISIPIFLAT